MAWAFSGVYCFRCFAQAIEDRPHADPRAVGQLDVVAARQSRSQLAQRQRAPAAAVLLAARHQGEAVGRFVPEVELAVAAVLLQVRLPQEAVVVGAHQDRQIGLLAHVLAVVQLVRDDHLRGRQAQRRIGLGLRVDPQIRVNAGGVVVRGDDHQLGAAVARLVHVVDLGDARIGGVADPDDDVVRAEPVGGGSLAVVHAPGLDRAHGHVADTRPRVEDRGAHRLGEADLTGGLRPIAGVGGAVVVDHRLGPLLDGRIDDRVGDLAQRFVPADALPLARAALADALQGVGDARRRHLEVAVAGALLAAARIRVGNVLARAPVDGVLLLAPADAVLHEDVPRTGGNAVGPGVGSLGDAIPGPALAVDVGEVVVGDGCDLDALGQRRTDPFVRVAPAAAELMQAEGQAGRPRARSDEEAAPGEGASRSVLHAASTSTRVSRSLWPGWRHNSIGRR